MTSLIVFFDGSCEPVNPGGNIGAGVVFYECLNFKLDVIKKNKFNTLKSSYDSIKLIHTESKFHSNGENLFEVTTNNVAEHYAAFVGLNFALESEYNDIFIFGDSKMVINQLMKRWKLNPEKPYYNFALKNQMIVDEIKNKKRTIRLYWIPRELNKVADKLSKKI